VLHPPPTLPGGRWPSTDRHPRFAAHCGEAPTGRRESIEDVGAFLDHSSLAVTTVYLRRLEGQEDRTWREVAEVIEV
jgi:hypothetical protein